MGRPYVLCGLFSHGDVVVLMAIPFAFGLDLDDPIADSLFSQVKGLLVASGSLELTESLADGGLPLAVARGA